MAQGFLDLAITPSVKAAQARMGSDGLWTRPRPSDRFTEDEIAFLESRDSFYMATVSETGWPYVQHRGGPPGFVKVIDDRTLAVADYRGNRQYLSVGNLAASDRACLIAVDYPQRARLKLYVHVEIVAPDADPELARRVTMPDHRAKIERIFRMRLEAFDWNCPQHITPRYTEREIADAVRPLHERVAELEAENAALRAVK